MVFATELEEAALAFRRAKRDLSRCEERYDRASGTDSTELIEDIKAAERELAVAKLALKQLGRHF